YIEDKDIYAFHKKYGYGVRSLAEAQISRIKRCIGERLLTQELASQEGEGIIIANPVFAAMTWRENFSTSSVGSARRN
ncbi:hypothetical protein AB3X89_39485, partial [Paraburkholderia sp. BR14320]